MRLVGRLGRVCYGVLCGLLVVGMLLTAAAVIVVKLPFPDRDGTIRVSGLRDAVQVDRDRYGVPQVTAKNAADLFFTQGWVHAQDRFWEMDFRRHLSGGRLAELFGQSAVPMDKYLRTMGWRRIAAREYKMLSVAAQTGLSAYAEGVNAYLEQREGPALGAEYALLGLQGRSYRPARWTPVDSLAWLKVMAWQLRGNDDQELARALLPEQLPNKRMAELYPDYPYDRHRPIVGDGKVRSGAFVTDDRRRSTAAGRPPVAADGSARPARAAIRTSLAEAGKVLDGISSVAGKAGGAIGSNAWAVAGERTASGEPILANDPHLGAAMPSTWYQVGLRCAPVSPSCPYSVAGFGLAGVPGVVIGHNDRIAWGFTNLGPDVADLYLEKVRGDFYEYDGNRVALTRRKEVIKVAGGKPVRMTVRSTRHGPLLSGVDDGLGRLSRRAGERYEVALRWTALSPGRTADAIFEMNTASDFDEFRAAAQLFDAPAQNLVYADVDGHIGYQASGKVPIRKGYDGTTPAKGWTGKDEWKGYVPFAAMPYAFDPEEGYVVTANQAVVDEAKYPYSLTRDWDPGFRSQRIVEMITKAEDPLTVTANEQMQLDTLNPAAAIVVPYLRKVAPPAGTTHARALLTRWDYHSQADSAPAAYFNAVWRHLLARTFHDQLPAGARPDGQARWFLVMEKLLRSPRSVWWDDARTSSVRETRDDILAQSMGEAYDELSGTLGSDPSTWRWGDLHTLTVRNQSFGASGIAAVEALFNRGPLRLGGGSAVVNATGWSTLDGYSVTSVPSMRMVVDLGDLDDSSWVNLTGASGHTLDRHYFDQGKIWADGRTTPMRWAEGGIDRDTIYELVLRPTS
ncbi:MAG: penicillin acylase family protein [Streptosporangiales bacterium]|nr:penicillin acylase family protein [Streptosporangiales bacterium]